MPKLNWKKKKLLTILANRRQWTREFEPLETSPYEIEMEHIAGSYLVTQASIPASPTYIITE